MRISLGPPTSAANLTWAALPSHPHCRSAHDREKQAALAAEEARRKAAAKAASAKFRADVAGQLGEKEAARLAELQAKRAELVAMMADLEVSCACLPACLRACCLLAWGCCTHVLFRGGWLVLVCAQVGCSQSTTTCQICTSKGANS